MAKATLKTMTPRGRAITGAVALGAVGLGVVGTAVGANAATGTPAPAPAAQTAQAPLPKQSTIQSEGLSIDGATRAAQAALDAATKQGQHVSVAVVGRDGVVKVLLKGDGSGPQSQESAERKAFTAVSWNAPTSELAKRLATTPTLEDIPGTLFLAGGAPVQDKGAPVAAIGVAGAPSGDLDEQFAQAGVAALAQH